MSKSSLVVNGNACKAAPGDTLVEAAMAARIVIPHDCCSGQCDTCRVRIYAGEVDPQGTAEGDTVLACQARVTGDAIIEFDAVPNVVKRSAWVSALNPLSPDIVEVTLSVPKGLLYLPGQYVTCTFAGFPARDYSPTLRSDGSGERDEIIFHIRRMPDGAVSSWLGRRIRVGHRVRLRGPFGSAFHRLGSGRLVLVSAGTGWAPIWTIARAARYREPSREMMVIAAARNPRNLYMGQALDWLAGTGARVIATSSSGAAPNGWWSSGRPTVHMPMLQPADSVYVAGAPAMVEAVQHMAISAGSTCYADPFIASSRKRSIRHRLAEIFAARQPVLGRKPDVGRVSATRGGR